MPSSPRRISPRAYRLSQEVLDAIAELGRVVRPGVELSDRQVIEAVVMDRLKQEQKRAARPRRRARPTSRAGPLLPGEPGY